MSETTTTITLADGSIQTTCTDDVTGVVLWVCTSPPPSSAEAIAAANGQTLLQRAQTALTGNATYLSIGAPTTAQAVAQVAALTRQVDALIRFQLGQFDTTT